MPKSRFLWVRYRSAAVFVAAVALSAAAPAAGQTVAGSRRDMKQIAEDVQRRGFADYIPVAYRTMGFDSDRVGAADNHVRAHFLLYMARDCSHFVVKWEIPVPVLIPAEMGAPKEITPEYYTHNVGPGVPKSRLVTIENKAKNAVLRSYQIGRMKRIWTRGPLNALADSAHARGEAAGGPDKWGALITCGLYLGSATPVAAYQTPASEYGDDLSGGAVLEISPAHRQVLQAAARLKSITPQAAPMSWRITANVFNATLLREIAHLKSVEIQIDFWGGAAMDAIGIFMIVAAPPEGALDVLSTSLGLVLPDEIPNVLDPLDVTWFITKACMFAIIHEMIGNLGEIAMVRLGFMTAPEPFQVAPWTFVVLTGPPSGTDTWNAVEMRGGFRETGRYRWVTAAGACTDWAARVTVRPSLIVQPGIDTPTPFVCDIRPTSIYIQMKRDSSTWEEVDKFLLEHFVQGVNAPIFWVAADLKVNYEITDQEILRAAGAQTEATAGGPSVTRRQRFHGSSVTSGAVPLDLGENRRVDFDRPHPEAVMVHGMEIPVDVTFERGILPQGGFLLQKGNAQVVLSDPVFSVGNNGHVMIASDYEEKWWYVTAQGYKNRWEAQAAARRKRRADSLEYNRIRLQQALGHWSERIRYRYDTNLGNLSLAAEPVHFKASGEVGTMIIRYIPEYRTLTLKEPVIWESFVIGQATRDVPDLDAFDPCLTAEGGRYILTWTNPKTKKKMTMIVRAPSSTAAGKSPMQR
jgi:hypothetical protein